MMDELHNFDIELIKNGNGVRLQFKADGIAAGSLSMTRQQALAFLDCINPAHSLLVDTFAVTGMRVTADGR